METKYAVDRIVGDIIVLEDLNTSQLEFISKSTIDFEVNDGDIIVFKDNNYILDPEEKQKRLEIIQAKFNRVRRPR